MAPLIIGVLGKKRHGKDTFAARLTSSHGFTRLAFADPMREGLLALDPLVTIDFDAVGPLREATSGVEIFHGAQTVRLATLVKHAGWEAAKGTREVRRLLQRFGTEAGREIHGEDVWVDATTRQVEAVDGPGVVITDVRFPNEAERVTSLGGVTVRVVNPRVPVSDDAHPSETALDDYRADFTVWNSSTIEDLHREADAVLSHVRSSR